MSKLLTLAFARVGHSDARLHGLWIPCFDRAVHDKPVDTIISLRNGGGKSSIIQLLYSLFQPNKRSFLGRQAEGESRRFEDYFREGELGFVVTEWTVDDQQSLFDIAVKKRIIGQCVLRTAQRQENGTPVLKRLFFSFLSNGPLSLASLPLDDSAGISFEEFRATLQEQIRDTLYIDPFCKENQKEWLEFLAKRGFLPEQFKLLAKMNEKEGGADQILVIKKLEQFMDLVLTPLIDSDAVSKLPAIIEKHRDTLKQEPKKRKEKEMVELLHKYFTDLKLPAQQYLTLTNQERESHLTRWQLALRIVRTDADLREQQKVSTDEQEELDKAQRGVHSDIKRLVNELRWLRKEELRLTYAEKAADYEAAHQTLKEAEEDLAFHVAAQKLGELNEIKSDCAALETAIGQANAPAEKLLDRLHAIGFVYRQVLADKLQIMAHELTAQRHQRNKLQTSQAAAQTDLGSTQSEIKQLTTDIAKLRQWLAESDAKQHDLYQQGILQSDEQASTALARLNESKSVLEVRIGQYATNIDKLTDAIHATNIKTTAIATDINHHRQEEQKIVRDLSDYQRAYDEQAENSVLRGLLETQTVEPYTPELTTQIKHDQAKLDQELRSLENLLDLDREELAALEQNHLLPPAQDVRLALSTLQQAGIEAFSYGEYHAEQGDSIATVRDMLTRDTARYGGIGVQNPADLLRIQTEFQTLQNLRGPVQVTLVSAPEQTQPQVDCVTLLPQSNATFNRAAAGREKAVLEKRIAADEERQAQIQQEQETYQQTLTDLQFFLKQYPPGTKVHYQTQKAEALQRVIAAEKLLTASQAETNELNVQKTKLAAELTIAQQALIECQKNVTTVQAYVEQYAAQQENQQQTLTQAHTQQHTQQEHLEILKQTITNYDLCAQDLDKSIVEQQEKNTLLTEQLEYVRFHSPNHENMVAEYLGFSQTELKTHYKTAKTSYKKEAGAALELQGKLEEKQEQQTKSNNNYQEKAQGLSEARIAGTLLACQGEVADSLLEQLDRKKQACQDMTTEAKVRKQDMEKDLRQFTDAGEFFQPAELSEFSELSTCQQSKRQWEETLENIRQREQELHRNSKEIEKRLAEISGNLKLLHTAVNAAREYCPEVLALELQLPFASAEEAEQAWTRQVKSSDELSKQLEAAKQHISKLQGTIKRTLNDPHYEDVDQMLRSRLLDIPEYFKNLEQHLHDLNERLHVLISSLERAKQGRAEVVSLFSYPVKLAIQSLSNLEKASKCPPNQGMWLAWSEQPFIEVKINKKVSQNDFFQATLVDYIEQLVNRKGNIIEDPTTLVRHGAYAVLQDKIKIRILKPSDSPTLERTSITDVGVFSGGQKLTVAIMIYCSIINLLNLERKTEVGACNMLLLDNPLGTCNYSSFIQMQREMARLNEIQLIYATGINDANAVGEFRRIVTLQNKHRNTKTGDRYVTEEQPAVETVSAQFKDAITSH